LLCVARPRAREPTLRGARAEVSLEQFFFATIFAKSMDYTVFLRSATKQHWDHRTTPNRRRSAWLRTPDA
jgi:hypothetical protein